MKESIKKKFDSIDKSKIKVESTKELLAKIEKALNGKIEENADKAEALLDKFIAQAKAKNADIFVSKKAEPTLTPTEKKKATQVVKSKLETLMDTIANDPLLKDFNNSRRSKGGGKSDPLIDSERKAIQSGPRVSKKGWKNQYGKSDGGRKYYEYRENRIDRKAPNYGNRPWLKEGGFIHPSDANADKYVVVEIKADGSRREHNNFGDLETARMFASLKREFLPKGSQLMIEDKNGKNLYRSFKSGGMMSEQDYEKGFENEKTHLDSEDFAKISARVDEEYLAKDRKSGVHDKFTKYWYSGGREKAIAKYGEDESNAWEESYEDFKEDFYKMAKGGRVDESTAMVLSQNKAIAHHTEELKKAIAKNKKVEPWVVAKIERASTDISDVTHYLDGKTEYAKGGKIENQYEGRSDSDIWNSWTKEQKYHFLDDHNDEFPQIGRNEKKILQNVEYNNILNADIEDSLKRHIRQGEYANGGEIEGVDLFEDYEDQPQEVKSILANYEMEDNDYETLQNLKAELESIGYTMDFGLDAEPYDLRKIGEKGKSEFYANGGMMADGGKIRWQDVYVGDNALVIAENKMGMVVKPYGRRFHLKFPDGSEKTYSAEELEFFKDEEFAKGGKTPTGNYTNRRNLHLIVIKNPNKSGSNNYLTIDKKDFLDGLHKMEDGGSLSKGYTYIKRADVNQVAYYDKSGKLQVEFKPKNGFWVSKKALVDAGMNETKAKFNAQDVANELSALSNEAWDKLSIQSGSEIYASDTLQQDLADEYQRLGINKIYKQLTKAERKKVSDVLTDENEHSLRNYLALRGYNGEAEYKNYVKMFEEGKVKYGYTSNWNPKNVDLPIVPFAKGGSTSNGSKLPEEMGRYFTKPRGTKVISMSSIIPLRARAEGIANAEKNMKMAYDGKMEKRKPITLYKSQGKYRVYDGNSTYAVAKANGWENIWAEVIKNPNMNTYDKRGNDIFTKAKAIRKEGEAWKDALQRAKAMK